MEKRPRQITMRGILWATFWLAVLCAAWTIERPESGTRLNAVQIYLLDLPKTVPLFIAVGALFGRAKAGALVGFAVDLVLFAISAVFIWYNYGCVGLFP